MTDPYSYITKDNFDQVRGCLIQGMTLQKKPIEIANDLVKMFGFPQDVAFLLVSNEIGEAFDAYVNSKDYNKGAPIK